MSVTACRDEAAPYLGRPGPLTPSAVEISNGSIWAFLDAVEDQSPLYWDEEFARQSRFGRMIAPPQMVMTAAMGRWWAPDYVQTRERQALEATGGDPLAEVVALLRKYDYIHDINVTREDEFLEPYGPGDGRLLQQITVADVSEEKQIHLGVGVFVTTTIEYFTEHDRRLVTRSRNVQLSYRPHDLAVSDGATEAAAATPAPGRTTRTWDSIEVGEALPALTFAIDSTTVVKAVAETRDLARIMYDWDFAKERGLRGPVVNTMWHQGLLGRYASDWAGPESFLRRLVLSMPASWACLSNA